MLVLNHFRFLGLEKLIPTWLTQHLWLRGICSRLLMKPFSFTAECFVLTIKDFVVHEFAFQFTIEEIHFLGWLQADFRKQFLFTGDDPCRITYKGMFQAFSDGMIESQNIRTAYAFSIRRIGHDDGRLRRLFKVGDVLLCDGHFFGHAGSLNVDVRCFHCMDVDIVAIDVMQKLTLLTVVVVYLIQQLRVEVGPFLKVVMTSEYPWPDIACDERCFDRQCTTSAHRVDEVAFTTPSCHEYHACSQYLVQRSI